jgi:1,4-alpha-glucan branching enzyme
MIATISTEQIDKIVGNQHHDPFAVLGSHMVESDRTVGKAKWQVRAYLPNAEAATVILPQDRTEYKMQSYHNPHFFVCEIETPELANYQLRVKEGEHERVIHDPYAFRSPLLTDFDIHLFAEGNHHRIYEKLGSHPTTINGVAGVNFAVWAPNARNVSIIGDFNGWDGRKHQMRIVGDGIWELFIPDLKIGDRYKYEIKNTFGHIYEKSDPYGFQQEVRPDSGTIINDLAYTWHDQDWLEKRRTTNPQEKPVSVYELHLGSWLHENAEYLPKDADGNPQR